MKTKNKMLVVRIKDYMWYSKMYSRISSNIFTLGQKLNKIIKHR